MGRCSGKDTTSSYHRLDVRYLQRNGLLAEGCIFPLFWRRGDEEAGSIKISVRSRHQVVLSYRHQRYGEEWQSHEYPVTLEWTPCHYGGQRAWFLCPALGCGRRVAVLYGGAIFACRYCHQLAYDSQRESPWDRALTRYQRIKVKLGGEPSGGGDFPDKPKGMHWRTYHRWCEKADASESGSWSPRLLKLLARGG